MFVTILSMLFLIFQILLALPVLYLLFLTAFAFTAPKVSPPARRKHRRAFAFLIPAHNEERLLPGCLASLRALSYPRELFDIYVVADNCSDETAQAAVNGGATCFVREDQALRGKPYALGFGLEKIWQRRAVYDGVVILDADSTISPNFLTVMEARVMRGEKVIQPFYTASGPERSWSESLRFAALAVLHFLRPQGRMALGGSAGLKGNGMVFAPYLLKRFLWSASLTEDIEYHMTLLFAGERVTFAPDAVVWGEMPNSLRHSESQHDRWERGRIQAARTYVPRLVSAAAHEIKQGDARRAFVFFDAAVEHLIPPFSILAGLCALCLLASTVLFILNRASPLAAANLAISAFMLASQAAYVLSGLKLAGAPAKVYKSLLHAPALVIWKVFQYVRILVVRDRQQWVRTARNEGNP